MDEILFAFAGGCRRIPSRLLGRLLLDVLEEVVVGRGRVAVLLHQVLPQRRFGRPVVPAPANTPQRERERNTSFIQNTIRNW